MTARATSQGQERRERIVQITECVAAACETFANATSGAVVFALLAFAILAADVVAVRLHHESAALKWILAVLNSLAAFGTAWAAQARGTHYIQYAWVIAGVFVLLAQAIETVAGRRRRAGGATD